MMKNFSGFIIFPLLALHKLPFASNYKFVEQLEMPMNFGNRSVHTKTVKFLIKLSYELYDINTKFGNLGRLEGFYR